MMLYLSRKIGWTFAFIFFIIVMGMFFWPETTRPLVGYAVYVGDNIFRNVLNIVKYIISS